MRLSLICCAAASLLLVSSANAADCDDAIRHASVVAAYGEQSFNSLGYIESGNAAANARIPSIDAARHAKACGCREAVPLLEDATLTAARANVVINIEAARGYGARLKKDADLALEALRRCSAR